MLTKVILEGGFAKAVGKKVWMLDCNSPAEAIQLIEANKPGIRRWIAQNLNNYKICQVECENENGEKEQLTTDTYTTVRKCKTIRFVPIFTGAGGSNGFLQAVVGVVMIVVGAIGVYGLGWTGVGAVIGKGMITAGIGMVLGAICTMLMSPSKNDDDGDDRSNYYFNGAVNTVAQGAPVPLVFGRCRVGSAVVSSEIVVKEA